MINNVRIALDLGVVDIPERHLRPIEEVSNHPPEKVCVLCTGSQGEQFAALSLMAKGEHRDIDIGENDTVIMSSHPIPGNERPVFAVMNALVRRGADVIHSGQDHVHTTGHAKRDELRILHSVTKPQYFCPIEGEFRMLRRHADLPLDMGQTEEKTLVAVNGNQIVMKDKAVELRKGVPHEYRYIHGNGENLDTAVLKERLDLAAGGVVSIVVTVDLETREIVAGPSVVSLGWATDAELGDLVPALEKQLRRSIGGALSDKDVDVGELKRIARVPPDDSSRTRRGVVRRLSP